MCFLIVLIFLRNDDDDDDDDEVTVGPFGSTCSDMFHPSIGLDAAIGQFLSTGRHFQLSLGE